MDKMSLLPCAIVKERTVDRQPIDTFGGETASVKDG
jgi:hypothetical protein